MAGFLDTPVRQKVAYCDNPGTVTLWVEDYEITMVKELAVKILEDLPQAIKDCMNFMEVE